MNVRSYTDKQILDRVKSKARGFTHIPESLWAVGVQSNEDATNKFDDKMYFFRGEQFIKVIPVTTNAGINGLKHFDKYNSEGVAVLQTDRIVYDFWKRGLHRGKVAAGVQNKCWAFYRDGNKNDKIEEIGGLHYDIIGINFHPATYEEGSTTAKEDINGWSLGCQVTQVKADHEYIMSLEWDYLTYCLLKEWEV